MTRYPISVTITKPAMIATQKKRFSDGFAYFLLTIPPLCWAGNVVLARGVVDIVPPVGFAFWRWTLAFLVLVPFTWNRIRQDFGMISRYWKRLALLAFLGIAGFNTLLYTAVHTTTAINCSLIQTAMPAIILVISGIAFREPVGLLRIGGVALCMLGASLVVLRGDLSTLIGLSVARGDLLMLLAVILYGLYSVLVKKRPEMHPITFLTVIFGAGALMLFPLYLWENVTGPAMILRADVVFSILYVALFPSIVSYFCWNRGIEMIGPSRAGLFINLVPVFASIMAVIWLQESMELFHYFGMGCIFLGICLFNRP